MTIKWQQAATFSLLSIDDYLIFPKDFELKNMSKTKISLIFSLIAPFLSLANQTNALDSAYLEAFAHQFLESTFSSAEDQQIDIQVAPIDPRIAIKPCSTAITANIPENNNSRNVNVKISCEDSTPWSMYLPARITIKVPVLVTKTAIDKGSVITKENVELIYLDENKIRGEKITSTSSILGAKTQRNFTRGKAITHKNICLVCKGDAVTIIARSDLLAIKTAGKALESGFLGENVNIRNTRSGKRISGRVSGLNKVEINL